MKLEAFPLQAAERLKPGDKVNGKLTIPQGSKFVHIGAAPPKGEMFAWFEVSPVAAPDEEIDVTVIKTGDNIPNGYEYMGYILAVPILFVYRRRDGAIILDS
jgi:hypothetical protein